MISQINSINSTLNFEKASDFQKHFCEYEEEHLIQFPPIDYGDQSRNYENRWFQISKHITWFQRGLSTGNYLIRKELLPDHLQTNDQDINETLDYHKILQIRVQGVKGFHDEENKQTDIVAYASLNTQTIQYELISSIPFQIDSDRQLKIYLNFLKYRPIEELSQGGTRTGMRNNLEKYDEFYTVEEQQQRDLFVKTSDYSKNNGLPIYRSYTIIESFYIEK